MASHNLKMFTMFILLVGCINLVYYAAYWNYPSTSHLLQRIFIKHDRLSNNNDRASVYSFRDDPKMDVPLIKVLLKHGRNRVLYKKTIKVNWTPEYVCGQNATNGPQKSPVSERRPENLTKSSEAAEFSHIPLCPDVPPSLGLTHLKDSLALDKMVRVLSMLETGGSFAPSHCVPTETVAIIVPYRYLRGQETLLILFVYSIHLSMIKQNVAYQIYVIKEYDEKKPVNSGLLFNIGFIETLKLGLDNITCVVFHEPNLAPKDSRNLYRCSEQPKQLVAFVDDNPYEHEFGGVIAMTPEVFRAVNGFSNHYLDSDAVYKDMYQRLIAANYTIVKPSPKHAKYSLLSAEKFKDLVIKSTPAASTVSNKTVRTSKQDKTASGLAGLTYAMVYPDQRPSYTLIEVDSTPTQKTFSTVTVSTKSFNPFYDDETTTQSTTKSIAMQMSSKVQPILKRVILG